MSYEPAFIRRYLQYTENTEPAEVFRRWVAISLVAAAAERKLWVWYGAYKVCLHQFIMLAGPSGARKTTAIDDGVALLDGLEVKTSADSITRESLMLEMQDSLKESEIPGAKEPLKHNSLFAIAREFFSFFRSQDTDFLRWLVGIYDGKHGMWTYKTKHGDPCALINPCLNFLAATTTEGLGESIPQSAIGSGFTARIHFIYAPHREKSCDFPQSDPSLAAVKDELKGFLNAINQRCGEINWTSEAKEYYSNWYKNFKVPDDLDPSIRSWYERYSNFIIRLAGISCIADARKSLLIDKKDILWAKQQLDRIAATMPIVFSSLGQSRIAGVQKEILDFIKAAGPSGVARGSITARFLPNIEPNYLDSLLRELLTSRVVLQLNEAGTLRYIWNPKHSG